MNDTDKKIIKVFGIIVLIGVPIFGGWWYVSKTRECAKNIQYVPAREGYEPTASEKSIGGFYAANLSKDKGDYYTFGGEKFKTSDDSMRACMWEQKI